MSRKIRGRSRVMLLALVLAGFLAGTVGLERLSRIDPGALAPPVGPLVVDRQGLPLRLVPDAQGRRALPLPPGELPPRVVAAFVAAEDGRFWWHPGVDPGAAGRAAWSNLKAGRVVSGASTITMQLARLASPGRRTMGRKLTEMVRSLRLELSLSKDQILRYYLNLVPLGRNLIGVEAAARVYFGKPAASLSAPEAALLAALAQAPSRLDPAGRHRERLGARRNWVLGRMAAKGYLDPKEAAQAQGAPLGLTATSRRPELRLSEAPHAVALARRQPEARADDKGYLHTTLDRDLQRRTQAILAAHRPRLLQWGATQAAAVIVRNRGREVLALVGSLQYSSRDQGYNNGAGARRSPGSTLKPFLYAQALDAGLTAAGVLEDVERHYKTPGGEFMPANFDRVSHGPVSLREALGNSLNLAAVSLLEQVGPEAFYHTLDRLQLINHPERGPEHYGLGLVVGNPEVTLLQLAAAYCCLASGGVFRPLTFLPGDAAPPGERLFSPQAAFIVNDILADPTARARTFGHAPAMNPPYRLAMKTGTSTRYRDCWAVAYSPEYTLAVWVGNFDGRPTARASGAAAAAPILADLAQELFAAGPPAAFQPPEGVEAQTVCTFSGLRPGPDCRHPRQEWFIRGNAPSAVCTFHPDPQPWHRMPTGFAGWLHQRHAKGGAGRFRLAGFTPDLPQVFAAPPDSKAAVGAVAGPSGRLHLGLDPLAIKAAPGEAPDHPGSSPALNITYPLPADCFLVETPATTLTLTLKAVSRRPLAQVTWFVNGREAGTAGPPYERKVELERGRHRIVVMGPDGRGDSCDIQVQ